MIFKVANFRTRPPRSRSRNVWQNWPKSVTRNRSREKPKKPEPKKEEKLWKKRGSKIWKHLK
jgi:hypothetical protein